jgi:hypothetical protein
MNVLYIGIDNPLTIAMSGVPCEKVLVMISQGSIHKVSACEYIARPTTPGTARVMVSAGIDEQNTISSSMDFRVKMLPVPIAKVAGRGGGTIDKDVLASQKGIIADLEDFLFDVRFVVTQFNMEVMTDQGLKTLTSNSAVFTDEQKQLINSLEKGQKVIFSSIKAASPDGIRDLRDIVFMLN